MLTFDESLHEYRLDGTVIPSVTQVLEDVGIIDYSKIPGDTRDKALLRGRIVHLATQFDDEYVFGFSREPLDESTVSDEHMGYVEAWRKFRAEKKFRATDIEQRGYHAKYLYAGTRDRKGFFEANPQAHVLIDLKSGDADWWVRLQLAAYLAFEEHPRTYDRLCVEVHKDGTYQLYPFHQKSYQQDFNEFVYALALYRAKRERRMVA